MQTVDIYMSTVKKDIRVDFSEFDLEEVKFNLQRQKSSSFKEGRVEPIKKNTSSNSLLTAET